MIPRDWNRERYRTRDRLLEYDNTIYPQVPHSAGLAVVYPWENMSITSLMKQLYQGAAASGYSGTESEFVSKFGELLGGRQIIFGTINSFEVSDDDEHLYYDTEDNIMYYYEDDEFIPINALLVNDAILDSGHASIEE